MFEIYSAYFDNVSFERFQADLQEKESAILLRDPIYNEIQGFSTLMLMNEKVEGCNVTAIFSGDTIIEKEYWGDCELARIWLELIFSLKAQNNYEKFYWFLISMGYKTYRFLPVYFKNFFPCYDKKTPDFEQKILDTLAMRKFKAQYYKETGLISFSEPRERLKSGVADVDQKRLKNKHLQYFISKNPNYLNGDELACIAELSEENFKPVVYRVIRDSKIMDMETKN